VRNTTACRNFVAPATQLENSTLYILTCSCILLGLGGCLAYLRYYLRFPARSRQFLTLWFRALQTRERQAVTAGN
jgi:hypothetical protein